MKRVLAILSVVTWAAAPMARADDDCAVPMTDWQPRSAVADVAKAQGWTLRRIRIDDGCYEVIGTDAEGRPIEAKLDPGTLEIRELEFEDDRHGDHDEDHGDGTSGGDGHGHGHQSHQPDD